MNRIIAITFTLAVAALLLALGWAGGSRWPFAALRRPENAQIQRDTVRLVKDSLIYVYHPVPVESQVLRDSVARLLARLAEKPDTVTKDSLVFVELPVERKTYKDSLLECQVSGIQPNLDWYKVHQREITNTITEIRREKASRWGLGVQVGYGVTTQAGPVPYIGVGLSYDLLHL